MYIRLYLPKHELSLPQDQLNLREVHLLLTFVSVNIVDYTWFIINFSTVNTVNYTWFIINFNSSEYSILYLIYY